MDKALLTGRTRLEDKISIVRTRVLDIALAWVSKLLARQVRTDFRPRDDDAFSGLDALSTPTCAAVCEFLGKVHRLCASALDGPKNQIRFFTDLASGVRSLLFEHFRKFQINLAGGLMVSKDITRYLELLKSWPLSPGFVQGLEVLVEIGTLFVIGPEALKERLRGGGGSALAGVDKADLRPYLLRREDVGTVSVQAVLSAL